MDDYQDRVTITTPEGLEVALVLAGPATRIVAALLDTLVKLVAATFVVSIAVGIGYGILGDAGATIAVAVGAFAFLFLWDPWLEQVTDGRPPGKAMLGLRVVRDDGGRVDLASSLVRNLLRIVEYPLLYLPGIAMLLAHPRHQRIGDLAAGTYVVRERRPVAVAAERAPVALPDAGPLPALDLVALDAHDRATVRRFAAQAGTLADAERARLATLIAAPLRRRVGGVPPGTADEELVLAVAHRLG